MKRPQLTFRLIRMFTWWLAWLPFACVNICKYKQTEPQTIPVPDVATQALRQCFISNDDHQNQNGYQKEWQTFKFWFWISEGAYLPYVCGCWPMAVEATNLYGVKSFSIGGSLCVQIQIGNSVWQICIERSFSIARGSGRTISPTSAVKINIPAAVVKIHNTKIQKYTNTHIYKYTAQ